MGNLAIIPARGGSKRIPRKNIKDFLGKPIIAYSIETALKTKLFDEVMVSTDDEEIATIAVKYGAIVPFTRSRANSDDYATTMDVLNEVINDYRSKQNKVFEYVCCIYPTAPLINPDDIKDGLVKLKEGNFDSVFPIVPFSYPIWRALQVENDKVDMIWPENLNSRSQDLKSAYHDAGQWYWLKYEDDSTILTNNSSYIILNEEHVQDIDSSSDWSIAELKYKLLKKL
ncbi:pseudaminic acid cytidylyltransferase [Rubrolithibacter danxiaensis]|uniref:pseudaminic acid cytidylyltransferase n=1 Tax=Rubrolithibacter danxiaensis TaxID=3390805 RepID=UPI003BF786A5